MTPTPVSPPPWLRWIARGLVAARDREFLLADLDEDYTRRRVQGRRAGGSYLAQALHAGLTRRFHRQAEPHRALALDARRPPMFHAIRRDAASAWRSFRKQPGAVATIVLSLALGIGAATAMFSVVRAVLLAPLPYDNPQGIVQIFSKWTGFEKTWLSDQEVLDYQTKVRTLAAVAAWDTTRVTLTGAGDAARVGAAFVTSNTFDVFGVRPIIGRTFTEDDARAGGGDRPTLVVLSYGLWQRQFGGDADVELRPLEVNGRPARILGVMPRRFQLPSDFTDDAAEPTQLWSPLYIDPRMAQRGSHGFLAAARLAPGATPAQATEELQALTTRFTREGLYPEAMKFSAFAVGVSDEILGGVRPALVTLFGAVGFLLMIACANAAALLLARAEARQREFATRTALGATRTTLLRQQLVEGTLLALMGAAGGMIVALGAKRALEAIGPTAIPRAAEVALDWQSALFMAGAAGLAAILSSLPPAFRAMHVGLVDGLKDGSGQTSTSGRRLRLRSSLVVAQLAFAVLLLTGTGLSLRALWSLQSVNVGFLPTGVLTARIAVPDRPYDTPERVNDFFARLLAHVRAIPGVTSAGVIRALPIGSSIGDWGLRIEGFKPPSGGSFAPGDWQVATDGALEALGERLIRGRLFTADDTLTSQPVALVNETMAAAYFPDRDAIGGRFQMGGNPTSPVITVVGIVGDVRHNGITAPIKTKFYRPFTQFSQTTGNAVPGGTLVVRTSGDPLALAPAVREATRRTDPAVPLAAVRTMEDVIDTALTAPRLTSTVFVAFAAVALALSAIGVYGLLVFLVSQRQLELGVRVAIGASRGQIVRLIFGHGLRLAAAGVGLGVALAAIWTRTLSTVLYGVPPLDPITFAVVPLVLLLVTIGATLVPARRAAAVDPIAAIKQV